MRNIIPALVSILLAVLLVVIDYYLVSFVVNDYNTDNWDKGTRLIFAIIALVFILGVLSKYSDIKDHIHE